MKPLYALIISLVMTTAYAGQRAITDTGEEIIINSDGTWQYATPEGQGSAGGIKTNPQTFSKPKNSTFLLKSKKNRSAFWINTAKWLFKPSVKNTDAEYSLQLKGKDLHGLVITEEVEIAMESLLDIALENARSAGPDIQITKQEYRIVNGKKVLYAEMSGAIQGMKLTYLGYYYSDASGTTQFLAYTATNLVPKYRTEIDDLLNGFVQQ